MKRIIKYDIIRDVSTNLLKKEIDELKNMQKKLTLDIEKISYFYEGKDAEIIIQKYKERAKYIKDYIDVVELYNNYFQWIAGAYDDTHSSAIAEFSELSELPVLPNTGTLKIDLEGDNNAKF